MSIFNTYQNSSFRHCVFNLISPDDFCLFQDLKCIELSSVSLLDKHNFSIGSFTDYRNHFKVLFGNIAPCEFLLVSDNLLVLHL